MTHRIQIHQDHLRTTAILRKRSIIGLNAAVTDPLTVLYNRRYAQSHINLLLQDARSNGGSVTALMVDIDHFKSINDAHGHLLDQVICSVAHTLKSAIRDSDLVARFGGEEFVMILPNISPKDANTLAQQLQRKVSKITTDATNRITISIGISPIPPNYLKVGWKIMTSCVKRRIRPCITRNVPGEIVLPITVIRPKPPRL